MKVVRNQIFEQTVSPEVEEIINLKWL